MNKRGVRLVGVVAVLLFLMIGVSGSIAQNDPFTVVFLGESSSTDIIWSYRVERLQEAADAVGADFSFRFAEGDYARHAEMIDEEVARGVDAIIGPWWDQTIYNDAFTNAVENGVLIYGLLGIEPRYTLPEEIVSQLAWAETSWEEFGRKAAEVALDHVPDGSKVFWPAEAPSGTYITDAVQGFTDYYTEQGRTVEIEVVEVGFDTTTAVARISSYLIANTDVDALITSGAIAINAANIAVVDMGLPPGDLPLIGQVVSPASVQGILSGHMPVGVNLELTDSSYYALLESLAVTQLGARPPQGVVGFDIVTKENVATVVPQALQG